MKIEITQSDIAAGEPCNGYRCGFALALNRQLPGGPWHIDAGGVVRKVGRVSDSVYGMMPGTIANLPHEAVEAIALYDSRGDQGKRLVQPFSFELDVQKNQEPEKVRTI